MFETSKYYTKEASRIDPLNITAYYLSSASGCHETGEDYYYHTVSVGFYPRNSDLIKIYHRSGEDTWLWDGERERVQVMLEHFTNGSHVDEQTITDIIKWPGQNTCRIETKDLRPFLLKRNQLTLF